MVSYKIVLVHQKFPLLYLLNPAHSYQILPATCLFTVSVVLPFPESYVDEIFIVDSLFRMASFI